MIIPVTLPNGSDSSESNALPPGLAQIGASEVVLIELQGDLEVEGVQLGQTVGKLTVSEDGKTKPTLLIGYHLLEGKVVSLPKPLAVLHRTTPSPTPPTDADTDTEASLPSATPSYAINAIVRKKLVFSKRPTPIVGLANTGLTASGKAPNTVGGKPVSSAGRPGSNAAETGGDGSGKRKR